MLYIEAQEGFNGIHSFTGCVDISQDGEVYRVVLIDSANTIEWTLGEYGSHMQAEQAMGVIRSAAMAGAPYVKMPKY